MSEYSIRIKDAPGDRTDMTISHISGKTFNQLENCTHVKELSSAELTIVRLAEWVTEIKKGEAE